MAAGQHRARLRETPGRFQMDAACGLRRQSKAAPVEEALHYVWAEQVVEAGNLAPPMQEALHDLRAEPVMHAPQN